MTNNRLTLVVLQDLFAVCRLDAGNVIPAWATTGQFISITHTADELSIVCSQAFVPGDVRCERGWRCLRVAGTMDFSMVGIVASLVTPLAEAEISVFVVSTFDTDYLLVKDNDLAKAMAVLNAAGHRVE